MGSCLYVSSNEGDTTKEPKWGRVSVFRVMRGTRPKSQNGVMSLCFE
jgi:hypothetical protein